MTILSTFSGWAAALCDLVLEQRCAGCGDSGAVLCAVCADTLSGRPRSCAPRPGCPPVWAAGPYAGRGRTALLALKDGGHRALAQRLAPALAAAVRAAAHGTHRVWLVPVPGHPRAVRDRGYDPAVVLSTAAAVLLRRQAVAVRVAPILRYVRTPRDQVGLDARERWANRVGAMRVRAPGARPSDGDALVLTDDVLTTGATLAEATRALGAAGMAVGGAAVFAERARGPGACAESGGQKPKKLLPSPRSPL